MKMVATAKLRRAQENILATRPYATKMFEVLSSLAARTAPDAHPLLYRREPKRVEVVVFTSDRGLCGAFNMNLIQRAEKFLEEEKARTEELALSFIGRKGRDYFRKRKVAMRREYVNLFGKVDFPLATRIGEDLSSPISPSRWMPFTCSTVNFGRPFSNGSSWRKFFR